MRYQWKKNARRVARPKTVDRVFIQDSLGLLLQMFWIMSIATDKELKPQPHFYFCRFFTCRMEWIIDPWNQANFSMTGGRLLPMTVTAKSQDRLPKVLRLVE